MTSRRLPKLVLILSFAIIMATAALGYAAKKSGFLDGLWPWKSQGEVAVPARSAEKIEKKIESGELSKQPARYWKRFEE